MAGLKLISEVVDYNFYAIISNTVKSFRMA
jgi:hypothetical protein